MNYLTPEERVIARLRHKRKRSRWNADPDTPEGFYWKERLKDSRDCTSGASARRRRDA